MMSPEKEIAAAGFSVTLRGFSAIDAYLERAPSQAVRLFFDGDICDLARIFEGLRYPGAAFADAALDCSEKTWYFRCAPLESEDITRGGFDFLDFYMDCETLEFSGGEKTLAILRNLKSGMQKNEDARAALLDRAAFSDGPSAAIECALILARFFPDFSPREIKAFAQKLRDKIDSRELGIEEQRLALIELLEAPSPAAGFEFLKSAGFVGAHWPELAEMDEVDHSKEFHPEGNVWNHTMETLRHRKPSGSGFDLRLSLALLLHDAGKSVSQRLSGRAPSGAPTSRRPFEAHAQLGEREAARFLARLGFGAHISRDVCYLVRNHMLPAALPRLPLSFTGEKMASPLFPLLMELYRCDESSSFKGLDGYYESSAAYQSFLRHRRNPFRSADGKKLRRN
ncbi:MAG: HD domain-containing protein [Treponema sp.]|nr:HD domain-containing protein [Treponema sp.]